MSKSNSNEIPTPPRFSGNQVNRIELHFSGDSYFKAALQEINQAQYEVLIESYIFNLDPIGQKFLNALLDAKKRGLKIKFLVDGIGSYNWIESLRNFCSKNRIHFRVYHPLPLSHFYRGISWKMLRRILFLFKRINKRNHKKVIIIDGKTAFMGSLNISQVHSEEYQFKSAWRDTGVLISGPEVTKLRNSFFDIWKKTTFGARILLKPFVHRQKQENLISGSIHLNYSSRTRRKLIQNLNKRIRCAKHRILITTAYFIPPLSILRNLRKTAKRGVHVALCLPQRSDVKIVQLASRFLYERMLQDQIHIYEYQPRILHAKTMIIDDWATVGSLNLNHRSLKHDLEVEVAFNDKDKIQQLVNQWDLDILESKKIAYRDLGLFPWYEKWLAQMVYWIRYWL